MDLGARAQSLLAEISDAIEGSPRSASEEPSRAEAGVGSAETRQRGGEAGTADFAARSEAFEEHRGRKLQVRSAPATKDVAMASLTRAGGCCAPAGDAAQELQEQLAVQQQRDLTFKPRITEYRFKKERKVRLASRYHRRQRAPTPRGPAAVQLP